MQEGDAEKKEQHLNWFFDLPTSSNKFTIACTRATNVWKCCQSTSDQGMRYGNYADGSGRGS